MIEPSCCCRTTVPMYKMATHSIVERPQLSTKFRVTLLFLCPLFSKAQKAAYGLLSEWTAMLMMTCTWDRDQNHVHTVEVNLKKASCLDIVKYLESRTQEFGRLMPFMFADNCALYKHSKQTVGIEHCSDPRFEKLDCCTCSGVCFYCSLERKFFFFFNCFLSKAPALKGNISRVFFRCLFDNR